MRIYIEELQLLQNILYDLKESLELIVYGDIRIRFYTGNILYKRRLMNTKSSIFFKKNKVFIENEELDKIAEDKGYDNFLKIMQDIPYNYVTIKYKGLVYKSKITFFNQLSCDYIVHKGSKSLDILYKLKNNLYNISFFRDSSYMIDYLRLDRANNLTDIYLTISPFNNLENKGDIKFISISPNYEISTKRKYVNTIKSIRTNSANIRIKNTVGGPNDKIF